MKEANQLLAYVNSIDFESKVEAEGMDALKSMASRISSHVLDIKRRIKFIGSAIVILGFAFMFISEYYLFKSYDIARIVASPQNIFVFCLMILSFSWVFAQGIWIAGKYEIKVAYIDRIVRRLQRQNIEKKEKIVKDYIDQLMDINNDNISDYYQQVRKNSNNLFISAVIIGLIGFFFVFISLIVNAFTNQSKDVLYISSVTGILLDSFAGAFFIQYGNSTKNMKDYYDGLLSTQHKLIDKKMGKS